MERVRLGIVGPGRIVHRVMADLRRAEHIDVTAVASRSLERAQHAAKELEIPLAFGSYEALARSDAVDLVYVALPHPFHCATAKLFLENGKHVIVEKPFAVNAREAREMIDCATAHGRFLMEAMWTRFFPMARELKVLLQQGAIGEIRRITGDFASLARPDFSDRLFNRELAGGSLLDVGVYPLSMMCYYKDALPVRVQTLSTRTATDVDAMCSFQVQFADGAVGQGFSALDVPTDQKMTIYGTSGRVEIPGFWHACRFEIYRPGQEPELHAFAPENEGFWHEFEYAAQCILAGGTDQPVMPLQETLAIMSVMDDMRAQMGVSYPME